MALVLWPVNGEDDNDSICHPAGHSPSARRQIAATFAAIAGKHGGKLNRTQAMKLLAGLTGGSGDHQEAAELLWTEMGLAPDALVTQVWVTPAGFDSRKLMKAGHPMQHML